MPLPGGPSDKYGNRYEGKWTVFCLAQVMAEEADSIRLEPPGDEGARCEFSLKRGNITKYQQVKRQHATPGAWSIADLAREGVLKAALERTKNLDSEFVFVSANSANSLMELTDAARKARSFEEFKSEFLTGQYKTKAWEDLLCKWRSPILQELSSSHEVTPEERETLVERVAYERLQRTRVENVSERLLAQLVDTKLHTLVRTNPEEVRDRLAALVFESVHKRLSTESLWRWAEEQGYRRVDYSKDSSVLAAVDSLNQRYESMIEPIADSISIPRTEAQDVLDILTGSGSKRSVLVSGEAGIGKTVILGQTIQKIRKREILHLYFRVDRLDPTELPKNVGAQLGLPASPVEVLAGVAKSRPSVLIIDQLDAVSMVSGRNPEFFHCVHEIMKQAQAFPNMRLLLACRRFDLEKDNRLRELISDKGPAQEVTTSLFSVDSVKEVLQELGHSPSAFTERQIELLQLPLHLSLFAQVVQQTPKKAVAFVSALDLFDAYWKLKRRAVAERTEGQPDQWIAVLDRLCDQMTERQTLFVPENAVLDDFERTVQAMESEHVLVLDGKHIGFFHEGFFDYVFARRFVSKRRDLIEYLKAGEQHLFKRAPLRQILIYCHEVDHPRFIRDLRRVVTDPEIRFHLKKCALETVGKIDHASPELWELLQHLLSGEDAALSREVWSVLIVAKTWFSFLHAKGLLGQWLKSDDENTRGRALGIIASQIESFPEESSTLLRPYVGLTPEWNRQILRLIGGRALAASRAVFDLFLSMVMNAAFDAQATPDFWSYLYAFAKERPDWAAEAIGSNLKHALVGTTVEDVQHRLLEQSVSGDELIPGIAVSAPNGFLDNVLPFFLEVVQGTAREREGKLRFDPVWSFRMFGKSIFSLRDALLVGLERALRALAAESPTDFARYVTQLTPYGDYDSVNFLLIRAFAVTAPDLADRAVEYVLENPQRLECGWASAGGGHFSYWAAREMIVNVSTSCTSSLLARLERTMLDYFPSWELSKGGFRSRGRWQLVMLPALDPDRRGAEVASRIDEWNRKFSNPEIKPPVDFGMQAVRSPIPSDAAELMSDEQWLRAIAKYNKEDRDHRSSDGSLRGDAPELSRLLEEETKKDPERFVQLSRSFSTQTNPYYFHSILRGLTEVDVDKETAFDAVRHFHSLPTKPGGHWMCRLIAKYSTEEIPEDIQEILGWLATEADDPKDDELTCRTSDATEMEHSNDILTTAINSTRGAAADAIGTLLLASEERVPFFIPYLERMVHDPTVVVRTTAAQALLGLYKHDEARAVDLFLQLCECESEPLLATHYVAWFLHYANIHHFDRLRSVLRRMLDSQIASVRETGARQACLAQFSNPSAGDMVEECLNGDDAKRKGAASVAQANAFNEDCREFCHSALIPFFDDPVKEVRDEAARCFLSAKGRGLEAGRELIRAFLHSTAFAENGELLLMTLKSSTADISDVVVEVCEAVLGVLEDGTSAPYGRLLFEAYNVAELVFRTYSQSEDPAYRRRCLDLVDGLLATQAYGIAKELEEYER